MKCPICGDGNVEFVEVDANVLSGTACECLDCGYRGMIADMDSTEDEDDLENMAVEFFEDIIPDKKIFLDAVKTLVKHAQEKYPHFEDTRGKEDIKRVLNLIKELEED